MSLLDIFGVTDLRRTVTQQTGWHCTENACRANSGSEKHSRRLAPQERACIHSWIRARRLRRQTAFAIHATLIQV